MPKTGFNTRHQIFFRPAAELDKLSPDSVDLVVTSPPYPMIAMWDQCFSEADPEIAQLLKRERGRDAFQRMHDQFAPIWKGMVRAMKPGSFACINIGDATRTLDETFMLYPNHARIINDLTSLGLTSLPAILWRKPTNAPNKFMGSGMLPAGAYVTLEHEYILIFRKGDKRRFDKPSEKENRRKSAIFWEERNAWFSDVWFQLIGTRQQLQTPDVRKRSAAFPFELVYRLINMFSVYGDTVLDPFLGTGTTTAAAIAGGRNSVGFEIAAELAPVIRKTVSLAPRTAHDRLKLRIQAHLTFVKERIDAGKPIKHRHEPYNVPVITKQETGMNFFLPVTASEKTGNTFTVTHQQLDQDAFQNSGESSLCLPETDASDRFDQLSLFS